MAINSNTLKRPSDRGLFLTAAIGFPLLVLIGYFKTYYFSAFFADAPRIANSLVHAHAVTMTAWVIYFIVQVALIRSKNIKLHKRMGLGGIALAALVAVVGMATAYDAQLVRNAAPPGVNPHGFFLLPVSDMTLFVLFFAGAVVYRKRPAEHKALMLLTAINFLPAALFRIPLLAPEQQPLFAFGAPALMAVAALAWHTIKHRKLNRIFAAGVFLLVAMVPLRFVIMESEAWLQLVARLAP